MGFLHTWKKFGRSENARLGLKISESAVKLYQASIYGARFFLTE